MGFNCGIIGLPNVGKSTLFNALTAAGAAASNYPFCTIDPNIGVVPVPDERLMFIAGIRHQEKIIPSTIEFVDIAGLVRGASKGEGLGNQFLSHVREVEALVHVVRCFDDPDVIHVDGSVDPLRDIEIVETELLYKDLETVERKLADSAKRAKSGDRKLKDESDFYSRIAAHLGSGRLVRAIETHGPDEKGWLKDLHLLTDKPVMYVCNVDEEARQGQDHRIADVRAKAEETGAPVVAISASVEAEITELPAGERKGFLEELGVGESGLEKLIKAGYTLLRLITFFTVNEKEAHAWTVRQGTLAPQAAGVIHSDFEKGFIRAEVVKFADILRLGSEQAVRDHGLLHIQGREYAVEDGDLILFKFGL